VYCKPGHDSTISRHLGRVRLGLSTLKAVHRCAVSQFRCAEKHESKIDALITDLKMCWYILTTPLPSSVGGTPVFDQRTGPFLRAACSRRVTNMWVNRPLQVSQLGQLSLSSFRGRYMSSRPVYRMCVQVAPSGECLRGKGPPDRMLAKPWRRLFLAAYTLWAKPGCCCCPA